MICWSCEKNAGEGLLCVGCGAIQPPFAGVDHFAVLGVERRFDLDLAVVEARYKDQARILHPDRYARADARARRASLQRAVQLNEAWRTVKDPVKRGEYLLSLWGGTAQVAVAPGLLMEVMELREALAEAQAAADHGRVAALAMDVRGLEARALGAVAAGFSRGLAAADDIARALAAVRYYQRFAEEVAVHEEAHAGAAVVHGG